MLDFNELYKNRALIAAQDVYYSEYNNLLGIALPEIEFLEPENPAYNVGQFYIELVKYWQIHLHFGALPNSLEEFEEEVKVLTRHEVEHYMTCPHNLLFHLRMLKSVIRVGTMFFQFNYVIFKKFVPSAVNKFQDIIIDSLMYFKFPEQTLAFEKKWISKVLKESNAAIPKHEQLMWLVKFCIWEQEMDLFEYDNEVMSMAESLAILLLEGGLSTPNLFEDKSAKFAMAYFKIISIEYKSNHFSEFLDILECIDLVFSDTLLFEFSDNHMDFITAFSHETSMEEFSRTIQLLYGESFTESELFNLWISTKFMDSIPIQPKGKQSHQTIDYPTKWNLSDAISDLDLSLTYLNNRLIPGVTTKKWVFHSLDTSQKEAANKGVLLLMDTSKSMGEILDSKSKMHQTVLATAGIIKHLEQKQTKVSLIGFNHDITIDLDWAISNQMMIKKLFVKSDGKTYLPIHKIEERLSDTNEPVFLVVVTDGEFTNLIESIQYLKEVMSEGHHVMILLLNKLNPYILKYQFKELADYGATILKASTANEIKNKIVNRINEKH